MGKLDGYSRQYDEVGKIITETFYVDGKISDNE